ncbi:hypothetical protein SDC9_106678 [bioreactor metagenome]|uniref:Uncharacterized protein n=1 Tax=bioreactor metagenome TaxID=1076179 RepID=A0A645B300_9ZZZZ
MMILKLIFMIKMKRFYAGTIEVLDILLKEEEMVLNLQQKKDMF